MIYQDRLPQLAHSGMLLFVSYSRC